MAITINYDEAAATAEGRMILAREYVEAHENFFEGVEQKSSQAERLNKIYKNCQEEIKQIVRAIRQEPQVERETFKDLLPKILQGPFVTTMAVLNYPVEFLKRRTRGELMTLTAVITFVFFCLFVVVYMSLL